MQRQVEIAEFQAVPAKKAASEVTGVSVTRQGSEQSCSSAGDWNRWPQPSEKKGSSRAMGIIQIIKPASLLGRILDMHKVGVS